MAYQTHELKILCLKDGSSIEDFTNWLNELEGVAKVQIDEQQNLVSIKIDVYKANRDVLIEKINNTGKYQVGQ